MLDPLELLAAARALASGPAPRDAELRRAISTAYYALFHTTLKLAAERFVGAAQSGTAAYALVYRGFAHGRMKEICRAIDRPVLSQRHQALLQRTGVSPAAREFASAFASLQELRHSADYDPQVVFRSSDAVDACDAADLAIQALATINAAELADILALLLVDART
ncbi:hypothetical protein MKK67_13100 [Methylobacterium sp. J-072]|uniref:hypothetical protein n=1 Tax=Methylobacterium sp. J-072 TaxID=2836651 RepID=UPI001FBB6930|nr:hypothetical protein [Methylobacterium sp. J-072]MCJ2093417.1 hypothetical protein [Methylobacterium sp. J-072]